MKTITRKELKLNKKYFNDLLIAYAAVKKFGYWSNEVNEILTEHIRVHNDFSNKLHEKLKMIIRYELLPVE
jgi:hypothetical protein